MRRRSATKSDPLRPTGWRSASRRASGVKAVPGWRSIMAESLQHKLDRVRRPRVHITYDVDTGGAMKKVELPFVVGVLADLSGQPKQALRPFKERKAVYVDRDNFNEVLARAGARLALRVPNRLTDPDSKLAVELNFKHMDDFEPARVAEQIAPL